MSVFDSFSDNEFIDKCYRFFLGRAPDTEGATAYATQLKNGLHRNEFIRILTASDEFQNRFNALESSLPPEDTKNQFQTFAPDGHYFSPIPNEADFDNDHYSAGMLPPIENNLINSDAIMSLANQFIPLYSEFPYSDSHDNSTEKRFKLNNGSFNHFDAIMLYLMIRYFKPKNIVEIGSGNSSALILDTNETYFQNSISTTFIEPYPACLLSNLSEIDKENINLIEDKIQEIPLDLFESIKSGDFLFVDSSHVSKFGSDLNHILFKILPKLEPGSIVHFHDIFQNFDYPQEWLKEGRAWNEGYMLRSFLTNNSEYKIIFFNDWFAHTHWDFLEKNMPLCTKQPKDSPFKNSGVSLWVQKVKNS